jgi:hypothetical protein
MLRRQNHGAESRVSRRARPLAGVQRGGREDAWVLATVTPLSIGECVHTEVQKHRQLVPLPSQLGGRGAGPHRSGRASGQRESTVDGNPQSGSDEKLASFHLILRSESSAFANASAYRSQP